jgi:hypothetical protein
MTGIGGTLLTGTSIARLATELSIQTVRPVSGPTLASWWNRVAMECGPATSIRALLDRAATPLVESLGFSVARAEPVDDAVWLAALEHDSTVVPMLVVSWGSSLDSAWRRALRLGLAYRRPWCLIFNGCRVRVLDVAPGHARRHLDFEMEHIADDEAAAGLTVWLLGPERLGDGDGRCLAALVRASDAEGHRVCGALGRGVHEALELLLNGIVPARRRQPGDLTSAFDEALTAVYRALFLFFAEARGLVPAWHPVYRESYTMESLRAQAEREAHPRGLWQAFQAISRLAHHGCHAGDLRVTAFNGRLFAPARAPRLENTPLDDTTAQHILLALSTTPVASGGRARIAFSDLGVEQLGTIYETLLEYEPRVADMSRPNSRRPPIVLAPTAGARRKQTGSFYTPEPLTRFLVTRALEPLVRHRRAEEVLAIRVLDPAMGSGAFLVAACRYLAQAYEAALVRDGDRHEADITNADRAGFRRLVAQRCLFGVDLNPSAVQLGRLSLWLTTLASEQPLTFLDHHLLAGDSLVGLIAPTDLARTEPPARHGPSRAENQPLLFDAADWQSAVQSVLPIRTGLERQPDDSVADVRRKEAALEQLAEDDTRQRWTMLCDLWCAGWFERAVRTRPEFQAIADHVLHGCGPLPAVALDQHLATARATAREGRFFHWALEVPEVFYESAGRLRPEGGFDAVIGNPPWEMLRADQGAVRAAGARVRFTRRSGLYHAQSDGHANEYQLFLERAVALARPGGRIGLVVPHGLASDHGAAPLRHLLLRQCDTDTIVGFENRAGVFPIHRSVRFLLVTATRGGPTRAVRCRFGLHDPATLDSMAEQRPAEAFPITLTPALLERLSGDDSSIPDLRHPLDLQIAEAIAFRHPRLAAREGWHVKFGRELNATDDRRHFGQTPGGLPVIEGKHVQPFIVHRDRSTLSIARETARRLLPESTTFGRSRLAFRDVASATNRTTLIAAIVPAGCVTTHTLFCLRTMLRPADQWLLCALFNSYVANFLVRMRVSTHVTLSIIDTIPVPRLSTEMPLGRRLAAGARLIATRGAAAASAHAEMQALAASAYGLSGEQFAHVLSTFPLVPRDERAAAQTAFAKLSHV